MKIQIAIFSFALFFSLISSPTRADVYTLDYDNTNFNDSISDIFNNINNNNINSASLEFSINISPIYSYNQYNDNENPSGSVNLYIFGSDVADDYSNYNFFTTYTRELDIEHINKIVAQDSLDFEFKGTSVDWYRWDVEYFQNSEGEQQEIWNQTYYIDNTQFALDYVQLTLETCNVPIPAAIWLLGSGFLGLVGFRRFTC